MLKKKDIVNALFTRDDNSHLYTVFKKASYHTSYHLVCLTTPYLVESYDKLVDLKSELACGYTIVGRFEELDVAALHAEKVTPVEDTY
jgi:hypothetical protein